MFPRLIACTLILTVTPGHARELEKDRQEQLCEGMQIGRYLPNGTTVDCVTDDYAIELDFSSKWAEAIRQSLMCAAELQRLPGITLICRADEDEGSCLKHGYHIEQTVNWWLIGMTVWHCSANEVHLADCRRVDYMQDSQ